MNCRPDPGQMARTHLKVPSVSPLRFAYRRALSASVVAHARYLATKGDESMTQRDNVRQKTAWQSLEARKAKMHSRLMLAAMLEKVN
jgi:hypothetical protein